MLFRYGSSHLFSTYILRHELYFSLSSARAPTTSLKGQLWLMVTVQFWLPLHSTDRSNHNTKVSYPKMLIWINPWGFFGSDISWNHLCKAFCASCPLSLWSLPATWICWWLKNYRIPAARVFCSLGLCFHGSMLSTLQLTNRGFYYSWCEELVFFFCPWVTFNRLIHKEATQCSELNLHLAFLVFSVSMWCPKLF